MEPNTSEQGNKRSDGPDDQSSRAPKVRRIVEQLPEVMVEEVNFEQPLVPNNPELGGVVPIVEDILEVEEEQVEEADIEQPVSSESDGEEIRRIGDDALVLDEQPQFMFEEAVDEQPGIPQPQSSPEPAGELETPELEIHVYIVEDPIVEQAGSPDQEMEGVSEDEDSPEEGSDLDLDISDLEGDEEDEEDVEDERQERDPSPEVDAVRVMQAFNAVGGDGVGQEGIQEQWIEAGLIAIDNFILGLQALEEAANNFRQALDVMDAVNPQQDEEEPPAADPA